MSRLKFVRVTARAVTNGVVALVSAGLLAACGGSDSVSSNPSYTVGGSVSGLVGTGLVLQDNGGDNLSVASNGSFVFGTKLPNGAAYAVTVATQPSSPAQSCVVTSGTGTVNGAAISGVTVKCTTNGYTVGGTVSGLSGTGLVLQDNGGGDLPISANGAFTFSQTVGSGSNYAVTVKTQPTGPAQTCSVSNASGKVGSGNVSNVLVMCSTYTLSGNISGLTGSGLTLVTNGVNIPITGSTFSVSLASGTAYNVTVGTQPTNPSQMCSVGNGTGTITTGSVSNVTVTCANQSFSVSGTIVNLLGTGLVLQTNGTSVPISGSTFSVSLPSGTAYTILATAQPTGPSQNCVPSNNSGTVGGANITGVLVTCTTRTFTVSGTISGLTGTGLVLQTNATPVTITGNSLSVTLASGTAYHIVVQTQPNSPAQYCVITNGSGTVGGANITNVAVGCRNQGVYAFVADSALSSVSAFSIVSNTGLLNYLSTVPTVAANAIPMGIAAVTLPAGAGTYVYTADFNTADVAQFSFNTSTNTLAYVTAVPAGTAPATPTGPGDTPTAVAIDPTGQFLLVADGQNAISDTATTAPGQLLVYTIDQTTGALTPLSGAGFMTPTDTAPGNFTSALALTVNPADTPYVFATNQFDPPGGVAGFAFNNPPSSGNLTQTAPWQIATGNNPVWVTVDPLDRFVYVSNSSDGSVSGYSLNLTSGVLTALTGSPFTAGFGAGAATGAIAIDPTGRFMYVSDTQNSQLVALSINPTTGALTAITGSPFTTDSAPFAVTVDPSGHFVYVGNTALGTISMFTADPETGALTAVGGSPLSYGGTGANAITVQ